MKKFFVILCSLVVATVSVFALSGCTVVTILDDAVNVSKVESERDALKDCLDQITKILDENGFEIVSEETDDGIVYSIVEKTEEENTEESENTDNSESSEQGGEEQSSGEEAE